MSKKMRGVSLDPSPFVSSQDAKARFKHQTLIQDYHDLQKEAEATRIKLETMKQRKLTLSAEVRFLRRRREYLVRNKGTEPSQRREMVQPQTIGTPYRNSVKVKAHRRKEADPRNLAMVLDRNQKHMISSVKESAHLNPSPVLGVNQKVRRRGGKESILRKTTPVFDSDQKERSCGGKEAALPNPFPILDLNPKERFYNGKETALRSTVRAFDLNQLEKTSIGRRGDVGQNRAPLFDLNQISGEEELQDDYEPLRIEEPWKIVARGGTDEQPIDVKLSLCRNVGNGPTRAGKRKISWQDQVALKV